MEQARHRFLPPPLLVIQTMITFCSILMDKLRYSLTNPHQHCDCGCLLKHLIHLIVCEGDGAGYVSATGGEASSEHAAPVCGGYFQEPVFIKQCKLPGPL